jgi:hypothetical protein
MVIMTSWLQVLNVQVPFFFKYTVDLLNDPTAVANLPVAYSLLASAGAMLVGCMLRNSDVIARELTFH